jgi:iron complex transport system substrate-binding protein
MRIVSLLPSATEIVCGLGLEAQLVGVTHECDFPLAVRGKPHVTRSRIPPDTGSAEIDRLVSQQRTDGESLYTLDFAAMRELRPDLIVTQTLCDVCAVDDYEVKKFVREVKATGGVIEPRVVYLEPTRLEDVFESIQTVAAAAGVPQRGRAAVLALRQRIERVRSNVREWTGAGARGSHGTGERISVSYGPTNAPGMRHGVDRNAPGRPRVAVLEWLDPLFTSGHWTPELVEIAGGVEPLARPGEPSRRAAFDELRAADPDFMLISCCGFSVERAMQDVPAFLARQDVARLRCVRDGCVFVTDGSAYFSRPGPRLVDGLEILAHMIDPAAHELPPAIPAARRVSA